MGQKLLTKQLGLKTFDGPPESELSLAKSFIGSCSLRDLKSVDKLYDMYDIIDE